MNDSGSDYDSDEENSDDDSVSSSVFEEEVMLKRITKNAKTIIIIISIIETMINKINAKADTLLEDDSLDREKINEKREKLIEMLKRVEANNIENLNEINLLKLKYIRGIDYINEFITSIAPLVKQNFCFIVDGNDLDFLYLDRIDATFGFLFIVDQILDDKSLQIVKSLLREDSHDLTQLLFNFEQNVSI